MFLGRVILVKPSALTNMCLTSRAVCFLLVCQWIPMVGAEGAALLASVPVSDQDLPVLVGEIRILLSVLSVNLM